MTKKEYLRIKSKECGKTQKQYKEDMKVNYIVLYKYEGKMTPLTDDEDMPVVFGGEEDAELYMKEGDKLITEQEYYDSVLG